MGRAPHIHNVTFCDLPWMATQPRKRGIPCHMAPRSHPDTSHSPRSPSYTRGSSHMGVTTPGDRSGTTEAVCLPPEAGTAPVL